MQRNTTAGHMPNASDPVISLEKLCTSLIALAPYGTHPSIDGLQAVVKLAAEHPAESNTLAMLIHYMGHAAYENGYRDGLVKGGAL